MKRWKRVSIVCALILILSLVLGGVTPAVAAPENNPGENPPGFTKAVFITYTKGAAPATPPGLSLDEAAVTVNIIGGEEDGYSYSGYHWSNAKIPVRYLINPKVGRSKVSTAFINGIKASFQTWEDAPSPYMDFTYGGTTSARISSLYGYMDRKNVVGWADLSSIPELGPGVIAVTIFWYNPLTLELGEVDVAMNNNGYKWSQNTGETWVDTPGVYDVDVQNIMTHEAGHWLVLDDLYETYNSEKTMYGVAAELELKKRSLDTTDITGIGVIYPGGVKP